MVRCLASSPRDTVEANVAKNMNRVLEMVFRVNASVKSDPQCGSRRL